MNMQNIGKQNWNDLMGKLCFMGFVLLFFSTVLNAQQTFSNFQELLAFADQQNLAAQTGEIKVLQAQKARLAAIAAIPDPVLNNALNFTNNTKLPVNLFPAEAFGGQKGEYREVQTGVQYNTAIATNLDIKLLNWEGWQNLKLAKLNIVISQTDKLLNQRNLYENLAGVYFNIVQLQAQLEITRRNWETADTLCAIAERKYQQGIAKQQDVNDSRVNQINIQENARQMEFLIKQQYLALKILADIPDETAIAIVEKTAPEATAIRPEILPGDVNVRHFQLKEQSSQLSLRKTNRAFLPTVSFVANNSYNLYNPDFSVFSGNWIHSQYIGLRMNVNLPTANTVANRSNARFALLLSQKEREQAQIQSTLEHQQRVVEWDKTVSQKQAYAQVLNLQRDTYFKNKNLYEEGIQGIDRTLTSFTAMLNAEYNLIASQVSVALAAAKIDIKNKFQ
jgi:outer membrane protein TolC